MSEDRRLKDRLQTGIPGLDPILEGGFIKGGVYLVQGPPGAGKTIFANQICYRHAAEGEQALYLTLLAESHDRMLAHLSRLRFFDRDLVANRVYYVSGFKILESEGLDGLVRTMRAGVLERKASLLIVDGLVSAEESSPSPKDFKKFIHELQTISGMVGCTVLLLSSTERPAPFHPGYTMVDGIIEISDELTNGRPVRHLRVKKMRGTAVIAGRHAVEISDAGLCVRPRLETIAQRRQGGEVTPGGERAAFGIPLLDEMLRGGLPSHSTTMLLGGSGTGKTMLGLQFLAEGVQRGERALHFGFYERPEAIRRKSARLGFGLEEGEARGLFKMIWQPQVETVIDVLGNRLIDALDRFKPQRLFIDGIHGFELALDFTERVRDAFSALTDEIERSGVTALYSAETRELFGPQIAVPVTGVSAVTQNLILLRSVDVEGQVRRMLSIIKVRDSEYDPTIRELRISDQGVHVERSFDGAAQILSAATRTPKPSRVGQKKRRSVGGKSRTRAVKGARRKRTP